MKKLTILLLLIGCSTPKTITEYKERIVNDTIIKERIVTKRFTDTLKIEKTCDTLGNLNNFSRIIQTPIASITLKGLNNNLFFSYDIDSVISEKTDRKLIVNTTSKNEKVIVKTKYPFWLILSFLISVLLNILLLRIK